MKRKALIVISSHGRLGNTERRTGWYLSEVTHIYFPLVEAGFQVDFASPKGGAAPMDESSRDLSDPANRRFLENEKIAAQIKNTIPIAEVNPDDYQVIHFAGGHGAMWDFHVTEEIGQAAARVYERGGIVASVCHGPAALVNAKLSNGKYLVEGKDLDSFTNAEEREVGRDQDVPFLLEDKLKERGARFHAGGNWEDKVVVSGRLITGQNPQSAASLGRKIVEMASALGQG